MRLEPGIRGSKRPCRVLSSSRIEDLLIWLGLEPTLSWADAAPDINRKAMAASTRNFMVTDVLIIIWEW